MPRLNDQDFYYRDLRGRLLGNKAREHLILQEMRKLGRNDFFLEVGCAQGHFESIALKNCRNVFGVDYAFERLPDAREKAGKAHFVGSNAERLPFKSDSFDFVLCTEVLEHVPDWKRALKELQRVSRQTILLTVPLEKGIVWRVFSRLKGMETRGHLHRLDSLDLMNEMGSSWRVARHEIVATPSRRINRHLGKRLGERLGIYSMVVFEKAK